MRTKECDKIKGCPDANGVFCRGRGDWGIDLNKIEWCKNEIMRFKRDFYFGRVFESKGEERYGRRYRLSLYAVKQYYRPVGERTCLVDCVHQNEVPTEEDFQNLIKKYAEFDGDRWLRIDPVKEYGDR